MCARVLYICDILSVFTMYVNTLNTFRSAITNI